MELKQHIPAILKYIESKGEYLETSKEFFEVLCCSADTPY